MKLPVVISMLIASAVAAAQPVPPVAKTVPHVVKGPQGERVDEYYWMRDDDPKAKRPEILEHLRAENAYADALLAPLAPLREKLVAEMRSRIRDEDSSVPVYNEGWWLWREFKPGAEYPVIMRQRGSAERPDPKAAREVVIDQPALAAGKPYFNLGGYAISPDGRTVAWTEDTAGRRIHSLRFRDLASGRVLDERIEGVLESVVWANDNRTVFYILQDPVTLQSGPVYRHVLGTPAKADVKVYEEADKTLFVGLSRTASRKFIAISIGGTDTTELRVVDADRPHGPVRRVLQRRADVRQYADHLNGRWVIRTNEGAVNFKLVSAPQRDPEDRKAWRTLVPGRDDATLEDFALMERGIAVQERVDADARVRVLQGSRWMPVPAQAASTVSLGANPDARAVHLRFGVTSMVQPDSVWDLDLRDGRRALRKVRDVPGYDATLYATERLWAPARDGKRIPVTLAYRRDRVQRDGTAPLYQIGYGAYGYSYDATFSSHRVSLLDRGFVVAIAHVRGGAELGEAWYEAGKLMNKKNTFNDFADATDALVQARWARADRVFASGGSAGGLLMGVVANESGAKYRGIVLDVPFVDVVTTMLDETIPLTANEWTQWGDPRQKAAHDYMLSYSPYDQIKAQDYPAMLVTTGLWDSQVQYYEPAKYVARLRARKTDRNPLVFAINMEAGHQGASGRYGALPEYAREYAFVIDLAGLARP